MTGAASGESAAAVDAAAATDAVAVAAPKPPCSQNGPECTGCYVCDALWLPPGRVQNCSMGGDPFVMAVVRPPRKVVESFPGVFEGVVIKVKC